MKTLSIILALMFIGSGLTACETNEGPAEKAGQSIDNAVENAGEALEDAGDKIREKTEQ